MTPRRSIPALGAALIVAAGVSAGARASSYVYRNFKLPSGNIGCGYSKFAGETANLRCEIVSMLRPLPPRPKGCTEAEGVWGRAVGMAPTGRATGYCISDTVMDPSAPVLDYGHTWARGGYKCVSRTSGLTCTNRDGHGWFLSRASSRIF
ncbi:MAG: DUF6636 domain-containing protein [Gaiellaceae bacterium]